MRFKDRKAIANEYKEWLKKTIENNQVMVLDCPESVIAFVDIKGYLQEEKRGEWILNIDDWFGDCYKCSACGEEFILNEGNPKDNGYNYCPNCGAKMDNGGES